MAAVELAAGLAADRSRPTDPVSEHMSAPLPTVGSGQLLAEAAPAIRQAGAALVVDGGLPCAVFVASDVMSLLDRPA